MEYGLIGEKLSHSYSPMIHRQLAGYRYILREIAPDALSAFLEAGDFQGLNVTIPYKQAVMPFCSALSETARAVGSVNTLIRRKDGTLWGHNTDIGGFLYMLKEAGMDAAGHKAAILGSGGTSLTAQEALRQLNAREIVIVSRRGPITYEELYRKHADTELLINATPVGLYPNNGESACDISRLPKLYGVVDVIYNPEKTALLLEAEARGLRTAGGLSMLAAQAREAAELFSGKMIPESAVAAVCAALRAQTLNLVLIGMPGSGKSCVGRQAAQAMGRRFVDCDTEIVRRTGMSIPAIFEERGEAWFRAMESRVVAELGKQSGLVLAAGGGTVLRPENVRALRQNGRLCLLLRPVEKLARRGRPLSSSPEAVRRLWQERQEAYFAAADFTVDNTQDLMQTVDRVKEGFDEAARA